MRKWPSKALKQGRTNASERARFHLSHGSEGALSPFPVRQSMQPLTLTPADHRYDLGFKAQGSNTDLLDYSSPPPSSQG
jgi:hypothetical protein